jgi:hypothetical protein
VGPTLPRDDCRLISLGTYAIMFNVADVVVRAEQALVKNQSNPEGISLIVFYELKAFFFDAEY